MGKLLVSTALMLVALNATNLANAGPEPAVAQAPIIQWPHDLPVYDHVVIVVEENKDYDQIIGNPKAAYINGVLKAEGANFTQMFGEEHNSQGNYFWLFCGSNFDMGFDDVLPNSCNPFGYPFKASNLAAQLIKKGRRFKGYSESLPAIGATAEWVNDGDEHVYGRKHVPWISFANVPNGSTKDTSCNLRWEDFPTDPRDYGRLPTIAFVVPNLRNDMHNGELQHTIYAGDQWLKQKLDPYYQWSKTHNSLLIVTFDECDEKTNYAGLTHPFVDPTDKLRKDLQNRTVTIFAGARIKPADYPEDRGITHVNILRTLEAMYGLPKSGRQQPNAAGCGITDDYIITDIFARNP
jgi:acid phosphatase